MSAVSASPGAGGSGPFTTRTALALVLFGSLVFVALLWMIGHGLAEGSSNNGGAHAQGRGLNGYAALAEFLERRGHPVRRSRNKAAFGEPGLLVLTPEHATKAQDIEDAIAEHRHLGPTLLVLPKWLVAPVPAQVRATTKAQPGWVILADARPPRWAGGLTSLDAPDVRAQKLGTSGSWQGFGFSGPLPDEAPVQSLSSEAIASLVRDARGQTLAGYLDDGTAGAALTGEERKADTPAYPLVIVAEPDLLDNYGMADPQRAALALALVTAAAGGERSPITFDLTLPGLEQRGNLLTLAFSPPFLAATLCLLLAAAATGWRAFLRFGPSRVPERAIAFGKSALVANAAGLIVRSRRFHLLGAPYAAAARERLTRSLALPRSSEIAPELAALDSAARARGKGDRTFSQVTSRLYGAKSERELLKAAQDLHALERTLSR